eukprot:scaffold8396_cov90-Cylindrotheca_fusiformis.AAC.1
MKLGLQPPEPQCCHHSCLQQGLKHCLWMTSPEEYVIHQFFNLDIFQDSRGLILLSIFAVPLLDFIFILSFIFFPDRSTIKLATLIRSLRFQEVALRLVLPNCYLCYYCSLLSFVLAITYHANVRQPRCSNGSLVLFGMRRNIDILIIWTALNKCTVPA